MSAWEELAEILRIDYSARSATIEFRRWPEGANKNELKVHMRIDGPPRPNGNDRIAQGVFDLSDEALRSGSAAMRAELEALCARVIAELKK